ncbi:MAG TPA: SEC-C metal-binding domain-containing protein [Gammaproteobacteria bacterium]|nr:SEC-C metal-binding domain-containing protein [Gammaproteobacteria bacterium]
MNTPSESASSPEYQQRIAGMAAQFQRSKYVVAPAVLSPQSAFLAANYALMQQHWPQYYEFEKNFGAAIGRYADAFTETLLAQLKPVVEQVTGLKLLPCYSYLRIYGRGAVLEKHLDRPSCEISTSLTLGFNAPDIWPLCVNADGEDKILKLAPGDMLVYRGADVPHWRTPFEGEFWVQTFLHYVDANGEYADFKFDGRERIGPFDKATMQRKFQRPASLGRGDERVQVAPDAACPCGSGKLFRECHGKTG